MSAADDRRTRARRAARQRAVRRRRAVAASVLVLLGAGASWAIAGRGGSGPATRSTAVSAAAGRAAGGTLPAAGKTPGTTTSAPRRATVSIGWVGDTVPASSDLGLPADPSVLFAGVRDLLSRPDVMIGNLEGTLTARGSSKCGSASTNCYAFRAPPSYARAIAAAGFDVLNQANNHAFDFGAVGRADTVRALDENHLDHEGGPGEIARLTVHGVRIGVVGFSSYPWTAPLNDPAAVRALVRQAAAAADVVVVVLHGGAEGTGATHVPAGHELYLGEDRGDLRSTAREAIDAGADLVVGSGPHVVRGLEFYRGRLVAYSTGNFVGFGRVFGLSGILAESAALDVTLRGDGSYASGRLLATRLDGDGVAQHDSTGAAIGLMRDFSRADFPGSAARIAADGTVSPG